MRRKGSSFTIMLTTARCDGWIGCQRCRALVRERGGAFVCENERMEMARDGLTVLVETEENATDGADESRHDEVRRQRLAPALEVLHGRERTEGANARAAGGRAAHFGGCELHRHRRRASEEGRGKRRR